MMHTLAPNTMALQPTSAQKSPARPDCTVRDRVWSPLTGGGNSPRALDFALESPFAGAGSLEKSIGNSSAGTAAFGSSVTGGSSQLRNRSTITAAASTDEDRSGEGFQVLPPGSSRQKDHG